MIFNNKSVAQLGCSKGPPLAIFFLFEGGGGSDFFLKEGGVQIF